MIDFSNTELISLTTHTVGNKLREEGISFSSEEVTFQNNEIRQLIMSYFFSSFKSAEYFSFHHPSHLEYNEMNSFTSQIFSSFENFMPITVNIAKHLYEASIHPKIKKGELYVALFKDCIIEDELLDAVGIFKSESRDTYLKVNPTEKSYDFISDQGININKLDKGCLIFNTDVHSGYKLAIVDSLDKKDAQYWTRDFLNIQPATDIYHYTNDFLSLTKDFVSKELTNDIKIDRTDQVDLLNRSMQFFKEHETFERNEFMSTVLQEPKLIDSFQQFEGRLKEEKDLEIPERFNISEDALKKKARSFKSVLKLDENFHVYIHGKRELIEKGVDENTGKKFYKIYYDEEH
ncbi:MAG: nucleoid-associated protein [Cyclobacteriaceae bacterium]